MSRFPCYAVALCVLFVAGSSLAAAGQQARLNQMEVARLHDMMQHAHEDVKKHYYDPKYHGVDIDTRYREYDQRIDKVATLGDGLRVVAAYLDGLKDSHTFFIPPMRSYSFDTGYRMQMVGDACLITRVRPKSPAFDLLHPGDRVMKFNGFVVNRTDYEDVEYYFTVLNPAPVSELDVQSPDGTQRHVSVKAIVKQRQKQMDLVSDDVDYYRLVLQQDKADHVSRSILVDQGDVTYWKLPQFEIDMDQVAAAFSRAKKHGSLVIDLRGNPGGYTETLKWMVGSLFDHDVKIADRITRKDTKPMIAKPMGSQPYTGKLIVLVDSKSASCAELFARVVQLEHRGTVLGDRTAGAVMEALTYDDASGADTQVFFAFSVTEANLVMTDGKSIEKAGVTPDEMALATPKDLMAGNDPVMARASALVGGTLTAEAAGRMFPVEWVPLQ